MLSVSVMQLCMVGSSVIVMTPDGELMANIIVVSFWVVVVIEPLEGEIDPTPSSFVPVISNSCWFLSPLGG